VPVDKSEADPLAAIAARPKFERAVAVEAKPDKLPDLAR
jgi:hypothetical protein